MNSRGTVSVASRSQLSLTLLLKFSAALSRCLLTILALPLAIGGLSAVQQPPTLLVAAAADLAPLQDDLREAFYKVSGERATFVLASSGMLAQQIRQGAPYDVYLSANESFVQDAVRSGHIVADSVRVYAHGRLGLWSKDGRSRTLKDLVDSSVRHIAIANPAHAPYGMAAREVLNNQGLLDLLSEKLVLGENVRQAFQLAESGNADAVITAWTLLFDKGGVLLPESWHKPIRQAGGVVAASPRRRSADAFLNFLTSPAGRELLQHKGLFPPTPSDAPGRRRPSDR